MLTEENKATLYLLVQHVTRAFYDPRFIVVMDQLSRHQVLKDDDLAGRVGLQVKELNKLMATLEKDGLIQAHRQNELKEGAQRSVGRQYFYVDYKHFCNVVKWRVAEMHRVIDTGLRNQLDNKGYICPRCSRSYTPLDADKIADYERGIFICEDCGTELVDNENAENVRGSQDRMQRFNYQMRFIREGLRKSEEMVMPHFDISQYITKHFALDAAAQKAAGEPGHGLKVAGSTGERRQEDGIGIVLTTDKDEETVRRERDEEAAAKRQQNVMPAWHLKSTISGDLTALGIKENAQNAVTQVASPGNLDESLKGLGRVARPSSLKTQVHTEVEVDEDVKPDVKGSSEADDFDQYYASLAASAAPSTQHTPSGEFSFLDDFEEDRKPNIAYLDSLNEHNKRSRSAEDEGEAEKKLARVEDGWGLANGEQLMNGVEGTRTGTDANIVPQDDPIVYVDGKPMPFSQVGEEHHDLMTADEYAAYFEIFQQRSA
ncbi:TFIIE alpha subunit-domain-containing protein [Multifurca ochricompacta]|uniref:TFIIE alpha subunit-domain-containing protein n=1 Tax=Multifurca ochricompacta TaxID=376703 RepID=A0AAD4MDH6_9AGAM|nr:TFIIE alpha subunit-domain-containing protein [Multifurca ochricompacta]